MRIDQGRQNGDSRLAARASRLAITGADGDDATIVDLDPSIANWWRVDRQDPRGAADVGHPVSAPSTGLSFPTRSVPGS